MSFEDEETDRLLALVDDEVYGIVEESQPRPSPGSSVAVPAPAVEAITKGMAPLDSSGGELRRGEGLCQGSSPDISTVIAIVLPVTSSRYPALTGTALQ